MFCFGAQLSWLKSRWKFCFFSLALIPNDIHFFKAELLWICFSQRCVQTKFGGSLTGYFPSGSFLLLSFSFSLSFSFPCSFSICSWFHHVKSYDNSNSTVHNSLHLLCTTLSNLNASFNSPMPSDNYIMFRVYTCHL